MQNEAGGPHFELPPIESERPERSAEQAQDRVIEQQRPALQEAGVGKRAPQPGSGVPDTSALPQPTITLPADVPSDTDGGQPPDSPVTADLAAHDADLIEKEWIKRAKSIVTQTHDDPHRQKAEMSKIKADYIHKRFNKIIKTDEAAAA